MGYINNRNQKFFMVPQTDPLTLPASVTSSNFFLASKVTLNQTRNVIRDPSILGTRLDGLGLGGRISGTWAIEMAGRGTASAGSAPDISPMLASAFGISGGATGSPASSYTFSLNDGIPTFALYDFRTAQDGSSTGVTNRIGIGCAVQQIKWSLGSDLLNVTASGACVGVCDSDNFSAYTGALAGLKGGLTTFPSSPGSGTSNGSLPIGFLGSITADSGLMVDIKSLDITYNTGVTLVDDSYGTYIGTGYQGDLKSIEISMTLDDSTASALQNLKQKALTFAPINISAVCGVNASAIQTFNLVGLQLTNPTYSEGAKGRMRVDFSSSMAHGATLAGTDAYTLIYT